MDWRWSLRLLGMVAGRMMALVLLKVMLVQVDCHYRWLSAMSRGKEEDSHELRLSIFSPSYPSIYY
jgi:hypothetical protein